MFDMLRAHRLAWKKQIFQHPNAWGCNNRKLNQWTLNCYWKREQSPRRGRASLHQEDPTGSAGNGSEPHQLKRKLGAAKQCRFGVVPPIRPVACLPFSEQPVLSPTQPTSYPDN
eukprot:1159331-Pelagomonas_calceolata.AAC.1